MSAAWPVAEINRARLALSDPVSFPKRNALGTAGISFEIAFHQPQSLLVLFCGVRNNAVGGDRQFVIAHIGVVRGKEDAKISSNTGNDKALHAKVSQQCFQRAGKKSGMLRLQDKIIILPGIKLFDERASLPLAAMLDQSTKIGAPAPEIVIHIDHRNFCRFGSPLQACNFVSQFGNKTGQLLGLGEIEIVNYVHNDQGDLRFVGCAAMQISILMALRLSWSCMRHGSMAAINKSRLISRTNAALQIPRTLNRIYSLARVLGQGERKCI